jgi:hypothetical protein
MTENKIPSRDYKKIDPDDFENYEEQFVDKGGGGGSGTKSINRKGKKTINALKKEQRIQSRDKRRIEVETSLLQVLKKFPPLENHDLDEKRLDRYIIWIVDNIKELAPLEPSEIEIKFSKSGGPGGQNVNKRETRVVLVHPPTYLQAESDQARSQLQNRGLAMSLLQTRLQDHINDWKDYLEPDQNVDLELVRSLLDKKH